MLDISERARSDSPYEAWWTGPSMILGIIGHGLYIAWLLIALCGVSDDMMVDPGIVSASTRMALLVGIAIVFIIGWASYRWLSTKRGNIFLVVLAVLLTPMGALCLIVMPQSMVVCHILWVLCGIGAGCISLLYICHLSINNHRQTIFCTTCSFVFAALWMLVVSYMKPEASLVAFTATPIFSALIYLVISGYVQERNVELLTKGSKRIHMSWKSYSAAIANCICIGFACWYTVAVPMWPFGSLLVAVAIMVSSMVIGLDAIGKERFTEKVQLRSFLPLAAVGIIPIAFANEIGRMVLVMFLFAAFIPQVITNLNAVSENCRVFHLNPIRAYGQARVANCLGSIIGLFLGYLSYAGRLEGSYLSFAISLIIIFVFIFLASFVLEDHYPVEETYDETGSMGHLEGDAAAGSGETDAVGEESPEDKKKGIWKLKCEILCDQYDLSPRQREVLFLLAKGRNAAYIEEKLVVSNHTAKAHIYNIYKKVGVHSRQELISIIEAVDVDNRRTDSLDAAKAVIRY